MTFIQKVIARPNVEKLRRGRRIRNKNCHKTKWISGYDHGFPKFPYCSCFFLKPTVFSLNYSGFIWSQTCVGLICFAIPPSFPVAKPLLPNSHQIRQTVEPFQIQGNPTQSTTYQMKLYPVYILSLPQLFQD